MGYKSKQTTRTITAPADVLPFEEGSEPFTATIKTNVTPREFSALQSVSPPPTWGQLKVLYAPLVIGWNIDAPPPAEGGIDQFDELPPQGWMWLLSEAFKTIDAAMGETLAALEPTPPQAPSHKRTLDA